MTPDSLIKTLLRGFCKAFGTILGLGIGIFMLVAVKGDAPEESRTFDVGVEPNAEGVRTSLGRSGPVILQIDLDGTIGLGDLTTANTRLRLVESREGILEDDRVKAILLNINSGGGLSTDSVAIYHMIKAYKEQYKVPVIAYADGLCASGAYQIALAADSIVTSDCSVIGSIGVLIFPPYLNLAESLEKLGIKTQTISAGKGKDALNPFRPWQPNEQAGIQGITDYFYNQFVDTVTANRPKLTREKLINEYGAQIFSPAQAKEFGFIDETGYYLPQAILLTAERAGLQGKDYQVVSLTRKFSINSLFSNGSTSMLFTKIFHYIGIQLSSLRL